MSADKSTGKRKRVNLSVIKKLDLLKQLEAGTSVSVLCEKFGVKKQTVSDIRKSKEKLLKFSLSYSSTVSTTDSHNERKHMRVAVNQDLEDSVLKWFLQQRSRGVSIRGIEIQNAAKKFANRLGLEKFEASDGWLNRFRNRHSLTSHVTHGEAASAPTEEVAPFKIMLSELVKDQSLQLFQIYNADESGIFWRSLPRNTQALTHEKNLPGHKKNKDRISALFCANADGTHRLKIAIVGKSARPRALKNILKSIPVHYYSSKKAWFNLVIFEDWFFKKFIPAVRQHQQDVLKIPADEVKALLILDNAPTHPVAEKLVSSDGKIKILFLPPNLTSIIQPMDQGVIVACKRLYQGKYLEEVLAVLEEEDDLIEDKRGEKTLNNIKQYSIKSAIFNLNDAWQTLKMSTLTHAWKKIGLNNDNVEKELQSYCCEPGEFIKVFRRRGEKNVTENDVREWLEDGDSDPGYRIMDDEEIIEEILSRNETDSEDDSLQEEEDIKKPSLSRVRDAIDTIISYVDLSEEQNVQPFYENFRRFKEIIINKQNQTTKQTKIDSFFSEVPSTSRQ